MTGESNRADELLDAALEEFIENGYAETGVREITSRVGVSHGTLYNYFDSRRHLLSVLLDREYARFTKVLDDGGASMVRPCTGESLRETMNIVTAKLIRVAHDRPMTLSFMLIDAPGVDRKLLREATDHFRRAGVLASTIMSAAVEDGVADPELDIEYAGQVWVSYIMSVVGPVVISGRELDDVETTSEIVVDLLLNGSPNGVDSLRG
ncbi:TetR/AcrR family transcriptional regulator [Gordonia sp. HY002]|uniref:TetR/AcrR family transcriptional regulator n=1 Tax=Gordonia zhenghanii TaxID=2911516 RepID=UPI001EF12730|nr:TetR/AcrR family transcriptional regulator [Gordonia zhenghanii]MCF8571680.1 TetR/AcrR family transcriptional regulator [Gordonia zhenghanii]MCF8602703.1 TetR/AcrR family transcriptional regulator [Gordonia zhenghanii]